ncbi:hypothetical protein Bca52824_050157 [Brassica carinata]|uniref:Uncharacterized protein n=1 Tax=Brassica carinata TaxID=52824 RepID=A0A8X7RP01_BRACI|nr:hypothetical protein Bca52824_050157 [Brassica carinata]
MCLKVFEKTEKVSLSEQDKKRVQLMMVIAGESTRIFQMHTSIHTELFSSEASPKSDRDPSIFEVKYVGSHTCNNTTTSPKTPNSVSTFQEGNTADEQREDIKPTKTEEAMMSFEDLESKKNIFRTFSLTTSLRMVVVVGKATSSMRISCLLLRLRQGLESLARLQPASVENSETADSYFSSLDNIIDFGPDWLLSCDVLNWWM